MNKHLIYPYHLIVPAGDENIEHVHAEYSLFLYITYVLHTVVYI